MAQTKDRYGRTVARVICNGTDANKEQVARGMAWVFDKYNTDRALFSAGRSTATKGWAWSDPHAVPPWQWRRQKIEKGLD